MQCSSWDINERGGCVDSQRLDSCVIFVSLVDRDLVKDTQMKESQHVYWHEHTRNSTSSVQLKCPLACVCIAHCDSL